MPSVGQYDERLVKEDLFGLPEWNLMAIPVLLKIAVIPIKASAAFQGVICHDSSSICQRYTPCNPFGAPNGQRISGERRAEGDERVRCMRVLGGCFI